jgi:CheY-like chemotaxis protein
MPDAAGTTIPRLAGKRVMVAEDELLVAMMIEDLLEELGCVLVGPFTNVADALNAAEDISIDLAVLDVNLRGKKIYPVAERLAARGIPFLFLSGYGHHGVPANRPEWRVCAKPFDSVELAAMMIDRIQDSAPPQPIPVD